MPCLLYSWERWLVPTVQVLGGPQACSGWLWRRENLLTPQASNPESSSLQQVAVPTMLSGPLYQATKWSPHDIPMQTLKERQRYNYLQTGTARRCVVSTMLCPIYTRKDLVPILQKAGWALGPIWTAQKISPPAGFNCWTVHPIVSPFTDYAFPTYYTTVAV